MPSPITITAAEVVEGDITRDSENRRFEITKVEHHPKTVTLHAMLLDEPPTMKLRVRHGEHIEVERDG